MPDDTTAPVTAEGLRERLISVIKSIRIHPELDGAVTAMIMAGAGFHITDDEAGPLTDALMAALAGDPGDLPARMAEALNAHEWDPDLGPSTAHRKHAYHGRCAVCQEDLLRIALVAMSVRWEDHARTEAENGRLKAELVSVRYELSDTRLRRDDARAGREDAEAELAEARAKHQAEIDSLQRLADRLRQQDDERHARLLAERDALKEENAELVPRTLNAAADKLHSLPKTDGAALKGPYWYRQGFTQAADLLRDWADYPAALDALETSQQPTPGEPAPEVRPAPETPGDADA